MEGESGGLKERMRWVLYRGRSGIPSDGFGHVDVRCTEYLRSTTQLELILAYRRNDLQCACLRRTEKASHPIESESPFLYLYRGSFAAIWRRFALYIREIDS